MRRLLLLLFLTPFCFTLAPSQPASKAEPIVCDRVCGVTAAFSTVGSSGNQPWATLAYLVYLEDINTRTPQELQTFPMLSPGAGPSSVPWFTLAMTQMDPVERMAILDPVSFLETCVDRYKKTTGEYRCKFQKQEFLEGKLQSPEMIDVCFREEPFSVLFRWEQGARLVDRALYVDGANKNAARVRLKFGKLIISSDPQSDQAKQMARYTINHFGLRKGIERTLDNWRSAQLDKAHFRVEYLGKSVAPDDTRLCYVFHRISRYPEGRDGVVESTFFIDVETLFQVRSELRGSDGKLIARYHFRDIQVLPEFSPNPFEESSLKK